MKRILLLTVCLVSALYVAAQIEDYTLPDGKVVKIDRSVFPDLRYDVPSKPQPAEYVARRKARAKQGKVNLPLHVNNGESKYFPPIFSQDGGSCGSAQNVAYMFTYEMACYRDLDASLPENQYPSHFTWLLTYHNSDKEDMLKAIGVPNVPTYGGRTYSKLFGAQTHEDNDFGWMQGYDKWYSAMWNRDSHDISFPPTNTPEGRQELKEWLYNHSGDETMHGGGIAGIGVASGGIWATIPSTTANKAAGVNGMKYVKSWGNTYDHALTICGYDDRIEFDLDEDGIVGEVEEDEVGAWIIANSWGDGWQNNGFIYCPYKYSYAVGKDTWAWTPGAHVVRKNYRPLRTIKLLMDHSHRSELFLCAGVSEDLNATTPDITIPFEHFKNAGNQSGKTSPAPEVPMLGRWADGMHYEPMEFGYDLTDLTASVDRTKPLKYFFIVKTKSGSIGSGHIYKASIINYEVSNEGVEIPFDAENVEIIKSNRETIISVIVPGEQLYPASNLCLNEGLLTWTAAQASGLKLLGYNVYEGDNLIAQLSADQTQFALEGDVNNALTVKAVYETGAYKQESAPTNPVVSQLPQHDTNKLVMFDKGGLVIPNAVPEVLNQATIEFCIRSTKNENYSHQIGPGWGTFLFHSNADNSISVGWNTGSDRLDVKEVLTSTSKWNHIAFVIDGNKLTLYVNGYKKGALTSSNYSGLANFGNLEFGKTGNNQWWNGGLDEIRVWKRALSQKEVRNNMYTPIASPTLHPDLLVYLPMDTMQVDGKTVLREWVSGKHATFRAMGTREIVEDKGIFSNSSKAPSFSIAEDSVIVNAGTPFQLTANGSVGVTDLMWTVADSNMPELHGVSPTFVLPKAGTYTISCTALFASGDTLTASTEVTVEDGKAPVAAFDILNDTLPAGNHFSFINRSTGDGCTYVWSTPGAEVEESTGTNATALYPQIGTFSVTLTASNSYGSSSVTRQVTVCESAPEARFSLSATDIILGDTIQLIDESRYIPTSWQWELNNGSRALLVDEQSPYIVPTAPGFYNISLTAYNELGENTLTRNRYLVVSNDDPGTCLNFTGVESLQLPCPLSGGQKTLTLEWWMRPQKYQGSVSLLGAATTSSNNISTSVDANGSLTVSMGTRKVESGEGYIILNEWHHYAIVFNMGTVLFYRDARLFSAPTAKLGTRVREQVTIAIGSESNALNGQIDEVRLWASLFDEEKLAEYCNKPISDIPAAQTNDKLLLYYDFNQNGGNVIDRTGSGFDAQRIGFGPDGDAWSPALGVFTLDTKALMHGDISADYLTNYKNPFITASGTVNPNNSGRFLRLAMGSSTSKWKDANAIVSGNITTGAHIDTDHNSDITFETQWSGFATPLLDYRLWQSVKLLAGKYTFSVKFSDGNDAQNSRLVVCKGKSMVSDAECEEKAIAWCKLVDGSLSFTLDSETEVSLGIIVNLTGQASFGISAFKLEGVSTENMIPVTPTSIDNVITDKPVYRGIYNISGQRLKELQKGINIIDGKKIFKK